VSPDYGLERRYQIGVGEAIRDHAEDHSTHILDHDDCADSNGRLLSGPEVELVWRGRLELGGDHPANRRGYWRHL
jgi:hypothetical protein